MLIEQCHHERLPWPRQLRHGRRTRAQSEARNMLDRPRGHVLEVPAFPRDESWTASPQGSGLGRNVELVAGIAGLHRHGRRRSAAHRPSRNGRFTQRPAPRRPTWKAISWPPVAAAAPTAVRRRSHRRRSSEPRPCHRRLWRDESRRDHGRDCLLAVTLCGNLLSCRPLSG